METQAVSCSPTEDAGVTFSLSHEKQHPQKLPKCREVKVVLKQPLQYYKQRCYFGFPTITDSPLCM